MTTFHRYRGFGLNWEYTRTWWSPEPPQKTCPIKKLTFYRCQKSLVEGPTRFASLLHGPWFQPIILTTYIISHHLLFFLVTYGFVLKWVIRCDTPNSQFEQGKLMKIDDQPCYLAFSKLKSSSSCPFVSFCSRRSDQLEGVALHAVRRIKARRQLLRSSEDLGGVELMKKRFRCSKPEMSSLYILLCW